MQMRAIEAAGEGSEVSLDFSRNYIGDKGLAVLLDVLQDYDDHICSLSLAHNGLRNHSMTEMAKLLREAPKLRVLDLRYNRIGDKGAKQLMDLARSCPHLTTLDVRFNDMSYRVEMALMEMCGNRHILEEAEQATSPPHVASSATVAADGSMMQDSTRVNLAAEEAVQEGPGEVPALGPGEGAAEGAEPLGAGGA